ncbi:hypothetical protein AWS24_18035 [Enterobacter asburiae]|nr:hypothetical protein AWS24_18035 [Enterobacter asburiae]
MECTAKLFKKGRNQVVVLAESFLSQEERNQSVTKRDPLDQLIAIHVISRGKTIVTNDRAFGMVQELTVED